MTRRLSKISSFYRQNKCRKKSNKRSFSLLEVLISISLLALLLSSLFFWYRNISFEKKEGNLVLEPMLEERYAHIRLSRIIPKAKKEFETLFYTKDNSLIFVFDHGLHPEPLLSEGVLGRIYHNTKDQTLCLDIQPHPIFQKETPAQTFVLLKDVTDLSWQFYYPPRDPKKIVDPQTVGDILPLIGFQQEWKQGYNTLPTIVTMRLKRPLFFTLRDSVDFTYIIEEKNLEINYLR